MLAVDFQAGRDTGTVFHRPILAHLPLALKPGDGQPEANDTFDHALNEVLGRVGHCPGLSTVCLMVIG